MGCCLTCACNGEPFECASVVDPVRFGHFAGYCASADNSHHQRDMVAARSRILAGEPASAPPQQRQIDIPLAGDLVEALAKRLGADRLAAWWEKKTGRGCGCGARREAMNRATETLLKMAGLIQSTGKN